MNDFQAAFLAPIEHVGSSSEQQLISTTLLRLQEDVVSSAIVSRADTNFAVVASLFRRILERCVVIFQRRQPSTGSR